ncbi:MAG: peptidoglycan-binding domain-containing protein [Pseudomonadota bacterium]
MSLGRKLNMSVCALALLLAATVGRADDLALIVSTSAESDDHAALVALARDRGFEVTEGETLDRAEIRALIAEFAEAVETRAGEDLVLISFTGPVATVAGDTFAVPAGASLRGRTATLLDAVPVAALTGIGIGRPEARTAVFLGATGQNRLRQVPFVDDTLEVAAPDGTLVVHGGAGRVNAVLKEDMLMLNRSAAEAAERSRGVAFVGAVTPDVVLSPEGGRLGVVEDTLWRVAAASDNPELFRLYLERFPNGANAAEAQRRLGPVSPEDLEAALDLSDEKRRELQQDLTVLGYDTRGIDGIYGPGTRASIAAFQEKAGRESTGYLTETDVAEIDQAARAARADMRAAREAEEAKDRAFWQRTGASGSRVGLRRYLEAYPRGVHAAEARAQLETLQAADAREAQQDDRQAWRAARDANTERAYRRYIARYPDGRYRDDAEARIFGLEEAQAASRAAEQERALGLSTASLANVEQRLRALGFAPGPADGQLTRKSRTAIETFQRAYRLPATGYLDTATLRALY